MNKKNLLIMNRKNLLSICAAVTMLLGTVAVKAATGTWTSGSTTVVLTEDGTLTVSGEGAMASYNYGSAPWHANRTAIKTVVIDEGVTSIGHYAFYECSALTSITIGNSVTSIGGEAFYYCSALTSLTIPNNVISIGYYAFEYCSDLTSVTIGNSVTSIGGEAFRGCSSLTAINIDPANTQYSSIDGVFYNKNQSILIQYPKGKQGSSFSIPGSVTSIEKYAFEYCSDLTSVTIGNSVISIGEEAFADCNITSITIPNGATSIGKGAFSSCRDLTSVTIPNSVTSIGKEAFAGCVRLDFVYVSWATPISILSNVFSFVRVNAVQLVVPEGLANTYADFDVWKDFYIAGTESPILANGTCGDNLTWALRLRTFTISGTGAMKDYNFQNDPFGGTDPLIIKTLVINEGATTIGNYAFRKCNNLIFLTIPSSVTSIGHYAFYYGITSITCFATTPPSVSNYNTFRTNVLYVPASSLDAYRNNSDWNGLFDTILAIGTPTSIATIAAEPSSAYLNPANGIVYIRNANGTTVKVYNLNGTLLQTTREEQLDLSSYPAGIYLLRIDDKTLKIVKQ